MLKKLIAGAAGVFLLAAGIFAKRARIRDGKISDGYIYVLPKKADNGMVLITNQTPAKIAINSIKSIFK